MTLSPDSFSGAHILIAGGGSGIGRATAELLLGLGATITVLDRNIDGVGEGAYGIALDARDELVVAEAVAAAAARAPLTGLVNAVGIELVKEIGATSLADWERVLSTNLTSYHVVTRSALPFLRSGASIVNVASQLAFAGSSHFSAYTASKAAIIGYSRSAAIELASQGIRVNAICPGAIDTPLLQRQFADGAGPQGTFDDLIGMHPIGRLGNPREIAAPIAFLLSEAASFMTGSAMVVDGGYLAQ